MRAVITVLVAAACLFTSVHAEIAVTVYNEDLGLIREIREIDFPKGTDEVRFTDVAARIIPTSVHFNSSGAELLEQNYEYDLMDSDKLLSKYVDRRVELVTEGDEFFAGTLLSAFGDIVLSEKDGSIRTLSREKIINIHFPDLPEGLITRPTLVWLVKSGKAGRRNAEISYLTSGMSWESEYVAVTDEKDENIELTGWVNITNHSGATYENARIKLIAGDVQVIQQTRRRDKRRRSRETATVMALSAEGGFVEQAFYEYHLYTLQRPSTIRENQIKQIALFPTASVTSVEKEYRMEWSGEKGKARVTLIFINTEKNDLGIPLPKGKIRVYKEGPDGGLEFIGEDKIDHTPRHEKVKISTGKAFDIVGERLMKEKIKRGNDWEYEYEIKLRNRKEEKIEVIVPETVRGDWTILEATDGWEKISANLIEWRIELKPDEERIVTYRVLIKY
ncbi:DUF4139 domain-containing protein [bacterium]|nr:DUF4139 domain-containing protein [bacterium]